MPKLPARLSVGTSPGLGAKIEPGPALMAPPRPTGNRKIFDPYDHDPQALAWARRYISDMVEKCAKFEELAKAAGMDDRQWAKFQYMVSTHLLDQGGCVIAAFDERKAELADQIDGPIR